MSEADDPRPAEEAALLAVYLRDRNVVCPLCEYNLRNLQTEYCPECGEQIVLGVQAVEPKIGWPITGLIGLSAGTGFSLLMAIYFIVMFGIRMIPAQGRIWHDFWFIVMLPLAIQGALLFSWLKRWKALRRSPRERRIMLALLACVVPLVNVAIFIAFIR